MKRNKILHRVVLLLLVTISIVYASKLIQLNSIEPDVNYQEMETSELQIKVEELSQSGELPFEMGLELINRWTTEK